MKTDSWYNLDGTLNNAPTPEDIRDRNVLARVTSILDLWPKPFLAKWKDEQLLMAAATTPRPEDMDDATWRKAVMKESRSVGAKTAKAGSRIHDAVAEWLLKGTVSKTELLPIVKAAIPTLQLLVQKVLLSEEVVLNCSAQYAGRIDLLVTMPNGKRALIDFKTRDLDETDKNTAWYPEQVMQLAAYFQAIPNSLHPIDEHISVLLPRANPVPPVVRYWTREELLEGARMFRCCLELYLAAARHNSTVDFHQQPSNKQTP